MCKQKNNKLNFKYQNGSVLIVVISILFLISVMIISIIKTITTNSAIVSDIDLDRKYTLELANSALSIAENEIVKNVIRDSSIFPIPNLRSYDQKKYPVVFTELLENGPPLEKIVNNYDDINDTQNNDINNNIWPQIFTNNCQFNINNRNLKGLCAPAVMVNEVQYGDKNAIPAWDRDGVFSSKNNNNLNSMEITSDKLSNNSFQNPRYIAEFLGITFPDRNIVLRVTARAWGRNKNNKVTLQSYLTIMQE